jgi:hypothetical protein
LNWNGRAPSSQGVHPLRRVTLDDFQVFQSPENWPRSRSICRDRRSTWRSVARSCRRSSRRTRAFASSQVSQFARPRASMVTFENRPCFQRARRLRSRPSGVRGPVLRPPCMRQRRFPRTGRAWQGRPPSVRARAPQRTSAPNCRNRLLLSFSRAREAPTSAPASARVARRGPHSVSSGPCLQSCADLSSVPTAASAESPRDCRCLRCNVHPFAMRLQKFVLPRFNAFRAREGISPPVVHLRLTFGCGRHVVGYAASDSVRSIPERGARRKNWPTNQSAREIKTASIQSAQ